MRPAADKRIHIFDAVPAHLAFCRFNPALNLVIVAVFQRFQVIIIAYSRPVYIGVAFV